MADDPIVVWFRRDLRLADQPALHAAACAGRPVLPVFIWAPDEEDPWAPGGASQWWLHHSLVALSGALEKLGSRLIVRRGQTASILSELIQQTGATSVYWNRLYDPALIARDSKIKSDLKAAGVEVQSFNHALLFEPHQIKNKAGNPFQVFTPFWKHCLAHEEPPAPLPAPSNLRAPARWPASDAIDDLQLLPAIAWDEAFYDEWTPGEAGAHSQLAGFQERAMAGYKERRDFPAEPGTSRMSPHLHYGEIGPRQIWHDAHEIMAGQSEKGLIQGAEFFLREVGWREFAYHLLFHFPHTPERPLREEFNEFPWREAADELHAWQRGRTGYPMVDAGMRELWRTGWMHNRVRMIVASFLVKDLLLPWQAGARWFWDTLVDADLASNTLGWQWAGGCGADAAPYFRIFNPVLQGQKFDPDGVYIRKWVPELADLPNELIHTPWDANVPEDVYPAPVVDHKMARDRALAALSEIKKEPA